MDWKELLSKLKIMDITPKAEGKQVGAVNVNIENKTENKIYNYNFYSAKTTEASGTGFKITPEFEERVKKETERRLIELGISPDIISANASTEIASATLASNAVSTVEVGWLEPKKK